MLDGGECDRHRQNEVQAFFDPLSVPLGSVGVSCSDILAVFDYRLRVHDSKQLARGRVVCTGEVSQDILHEPGEVQEVKYRCGCLVNFFAGT